LDKANKGLLAGFASNPMDKPEASKIGLFSIANWAWNVDGFDSEKSWRASFPLLFPQASEAMFVFAKHNSDQGKNGHGYRREESVEIKPAVDKALQHFRGDKKLAAADVAILSKEFMQISAAADKLAETLPESDPALWHEIEFWVRSFGALGRQGTAAVTLASGAAGDGGAHMALFSIIAEARARQNEYSEAQKKRHFEETFSSDKQWSSGCKVATLVMTPLVEELFQAEWQKAYALLGGKSGADNAVYKAFATAAGLKDLQAERDGQFVSLRRILEVVKLGPNEHIGLGLPEGVHANYIHVKLDNAQAADACDIEVSTDGKDWKPFGARKGGGELQKNVNLNDKFRFFRLVNHSSKPVEFRIDKFKFDVPADARDNSIAAATDGNPATYYTLESPQTFTGPAAAKASYLVTNAPESAVRKRGNTVTITPPSGGSVRVFEIVWR
jgi:hyaluronoglucosaminidase